MTLRKTIALNNGEWLDDYKLSFMRDVGSIVAYFKLVSQHLPEASDERQETPGKVCRYQS
jgi:hypothetical protein